MGKATILSSLGAGRYSVKIEYDNSKAKIRKEAIIDIIADIDQDIPKIQTDLDTAKNDMLQAQADMMSFLENYDPNLEYDIEQINKLNTDFLKLRVTYELQLRKYKMILLRRENLVKEYNDLNANAVDSQTQTLWCADRTENLSGTVGTVESCREVAGRTIIILPGHAAAAEWKAPYNGGRDGILTTYWNQTPHQLYTNRAYLPALAKWKPRFRTGVITSKPSQDLANVRLDPFFSSQQNLDTNQTGTLSNVPIVYMTCNGKVFAVGDAVVVAFGADWNTRKIIGFTNNPKKCTSRIGFNLYQKNYLTGIYTGSNSASQSYIYQQTFAGQDIYLMEDGTSQHNYTGADFKQVTGSQLDRTYKVEFDINYTSNALFTCHGADPTPDDPSGGEAAYLSATSDNSRVSLLIQTATIYFDNIEIDTFEWNYIDQFMETNYYQVPVPGGLPSDRYTNGGGVIRDYRKNVTRISADDDGNLTTIEYYITEVNWEVTSIYPLPYSSQMKRDEQTITKTYRRKIVINKEAGTRVESITNYTESTVTEIGKIVTVSLVDTSGESVEGIHGSWSVPKDQALPDIAYGYSETPTASFVYQIPNSTTP